MNYYHFLIYLFTRQARAVSKDSDDLFDRVFWVINVIVFFFMDIFYLILMDLFGNRKTSTWEIITIWALFSILNYIYLKSSDRYDKILLKFEDKEISSNAFRNSIIVLSISFLLLLVTWLVWFVPN